VLPQTFVLEVNMWVLIMCVVEGFSPLPTIREKRKPMAEGPVIPKQFFRVFRGSIELSIQDPTNTGRRRPSQ
jgi:hypothetical protein